jgi:hypothetical protein
MECHGYGRAKEATNAPKPRISTGEKGRLQQWLGAENGVEPPYFKVARGLVVPSVVAICQRIQSGGRTVLSL